jgi:hypothetical protein
MMTDSRENEVENEALLHNGLEKVREKLGESPEAAGQAMCQLAREFASQGKARQAALLAEKIRDGGIDYPTDNNAFDQGLGELYLYGGSAVSDEARHDLGQPGHLEAGEALHQGVIERTKNAEKGTREFKDQEVSLGRMGDFIFFQGDYEVAANEFYALWHSREKAHEDSDEIGPTADAMYGEMASHLMDGDLREARMDAGPWFSSILSRDKDVEDRIEPLVMELEDIIGEIEDLPEDVHPKIFAAMNRILREQGGSEGGVLDIDFRKLFDAARAEVNPADAGEAAEQE